MPLLKPKKYETNKMGQEYTDREQRYAVCQTIWKDQFNPKK